MTRRNRSAAGLLALALLVGASPMSAAAQGDLGRPRRSSQTYDRAYQIGFDAGYRRGYEQGASDFDDSRLRTPDDFPDYRKGDPGYNDRVGSREEYRNGFRSGFAQGYDDGVNGRAFGARPGDTRVAVPRATESGTVLRRGDDRPTAPPADPQDSYDPRGGAQGDPDDAQAAGRQDPYDPADAGQGPDAAQDPDASQPDLPGAQNDPAADRQAGGRIGSDESILIELDSPISTQYSKDGDRFTAHVVDSGPYAGAKVEGYVAKVVEPGRVQGKGELILAFQRFVFPDGTTEPVQAQVEEIVGYPGGMYPKTGKSGPLNRAPWEWGKKKEDRNDDINATVDDEGRIEGVGSRNKDVAKVGTGAVAGAIIGGILGGGSGAAVGATVGGAAGGATVAGTKGDDIELEPGCQLRIRTGKSARY